MNSKILLSIICALFIISQANAQSVSGNIANYTNQNLGYANVEVWSGNNMIANCFTDANGDFQLKLDSGNYRIEVLNAGYKKEVFDLEVNSDVVKDLKLKEDPNSKKRQLIHVEDNMKEEVELLNEVVIKGDMDKISTESYSFQNIQMVPSREELSELMISNGSLFGKGKNEAPKRSMVTESYRVDGISKSDGIYTQPLINESLSDKAMFDADETFVGNTSKRKSEGKKFRKGLTAGEINDFSKWDMWQDLTERELYNHQRLWQIAPKHRFTVQLIDNNASPIVDAEVSLIAKDKTTVWKSRTDNTGKAELWGNIDFYSDTIFQKPDHILINYHGKKHKISDPKEIRDGVNSLMIEGDCEVSNFVDIAFVVDATGSMGDEIDFLKREINEIMYAAKKVDKKTRMRFGNVFYRDHGDHYVTKHSDFTKVLSEAGVFIDEQGAAGGGDGPEAVEEALDLAINTLTWSEEARSRILFLVMDAPPHNRRDIREQMKDLNRMAAEKGIRIVPISGSGINRSAEYLMRTLALCTNGTYTFLTDHSGIGEGHLAPMTDSYDVQLMTDLMTSIITNYSYVPECEEEIPAMEVNLPDSAVAYQMPDSTRQDTVTNHILDIFIGGNDRIISWKYWPNPTMGDLNIEVSENVDELYLSDLSGKLIRKIRMNGMKNTYINLEGLATGIYMLRYPVGKRWISGKVVLTR